MPKIESLANLTPMECYSDTLGYGCFPEGVWPAIVAVLKTAARMSLLYSHNPECELCRINIKNIDALANAVNELEDL